MANEEQLAILKQGVDVWNEWRVENIDVSVDLSEAKLPGMPLMRINFSEANLFDANLSKTNLRDANLSGANLLAAQLIEAKLNHADLSAAQLIETNLRNADLGHALLDHAKFLAADLTGSRFRKAMAEYATFGKLDLSVVIGLEQIRHFGPSSISTDAFAVSKGKIPEVFLKGCGLSDWEIEEVKLYNPDLSNEEISKILYNMYDLRAQQALQISPLFISYSHADGKFVDKLESYLNKKGVRYWRDNHHMKAGRMEKQIDRAIRQNPTVLLVLSDHSLSSDWVEHEVRTARILEKEIGRDMLCPVALDDSWKDSHWPKRVMEQIMEYNILDFSAWEDDSKFDGTFRKLIDGLELFYKG